MTEYFQYGEKELTYLKQRDKRLFEIIDKVGWVKRRVIPNLFAALVHSIVGQQISTKAHETIWQRIQSSLGEITPLSLYMFFIGINRKQKKCIIAIYQCFI